MNILKKILFYRCKNLILAMRKKVLGSKGKKNQDFN